MTSFSATGVGEQFTKTMLENYPKCKLWKFSIVASVPEVEKSNDISTTYYQTPFSAWPGRSSFQYWKFQKVDLFKCLAQISSLVRENGIQVISLVLNTSMTIQIGAELAKFVPIPFIVHIWDTPEHLMKQRRIDHFTKKHLFARFKQTLDTAQRGITISEAMGKIYKDKYSLVCSTMVFSPPLSAFPKSQITTGSIKKEVTIVFAGGLYAYRPWDAFLDAVEVRNISSDFPKIRVVCVGVVSRWAKKRDWVQYELFKPIEEAARIVNKADVAYLPYWMKKKYAYAVQTAFPSKLSFYVSCGTPVFYHGPKISTPADFLMKSNVGKSCHSLKSSDILQTLDVLLSAKFRMQYKRTQERTFEQFFHPSRCAEIFRKSIDLALKSHEEQFSN